MPETLEYQNWYFADQRASNQEYWTRFGSSPDWAGKRVLDVGCGHGAMSVEIAQAGAEVRGVDLDEERIRFAQRNVTEKYPELAERLRFDFVDAAELPTDEPFDVIVSKDTFEHVGDLPALLVALHALLKPGGVLYAGFSPLYYSPYGDHGRTGMKLPWAHAVLPERLVLKRAARHQDMTVGNLMDLGLNGNTSRDFLAAFEGSPLRVAEIAFNRGDKRLLTVLDRLRKYPRLEKFATVSIYAKLEKPA